MPRLRLALLIATCASLSSGMLRGAGGAWAEDAPPILAVPALADRAKILATELRRGPADDLRPYLEPSAHPTLRRQAIRALGRIGDRAGAPALIASGLKAEGPDVEAYLQAAGMSAAKSLEPAVVLHAASKQPAVAGAALEALGWIGGEPALGALGRALHRTDPIVLAAAIEGLARAKGEAYLERVLRWEDHPDADVQRAVQFATWMLAGARRTAATSAGGSWAGDGDLAAQIHRRAGRTGQNDVNVIRPLGILTPYPVVEGVATALASPVILPSMSKYVQEGHESVAQEALARIYGPRRGSVVEEALARALGRPDPITRQAALEAAAASPRSEAMVQAVRGRAAVEEDPRVREALAVALAKLGDEAAAQELLGRKDRPEDPGLRLLTELRVLGASKRESAPHELVTLALSHPDRSAVLLEACSLLEEKPSPPATKLIDFCLEHADAFVRAAAAGLAGKHKLVDRLPRLDRLLDAAYSQAEGDVRQAVVEAWAELLRTEGVKDAQADALKARIATAAASDPSFTARAAARDAMTALKIDGCPAEDPLQPNDWKGLPRPKEPLLGVDLTKGTGPLTEVEILTLADRMGDEQPEFIVESDVGSFRLAIDPKEAPVHAVSFLLCVVNGVYAGTPWHRVVPSFVIQGGDPHGTGSGDAGWHLPDEITRARFVRGALGMPKGAIRDTGGCQLFVMHSDYRPLDGRYTCYGHVTAGMATVDMIRVGDKILRVGMVLR